MSVAAPTVAPITHNPLSKLVQVRIDTIQVPTTTTQTTYVQEIVTLQTPTGQRQVTEEVPVTTTVGAIETIKTLVITSPLLKAKGGSVSFVISDKVAIPGPDGPYVSPDGGGCFVAGTLVSTEHGVRPVEDIKAGDKVYAYDFNTGSWLLARVIKPLTHDYNGDFIDIRIWTPIGSDKVKATGNHPFWVASGENLDARPAAKDVPLLEQAMTLNGRWVEARDLRIGDTLLRNDNSIATIEDVRLSIEQSQVHNLEVEAVHNYAVGSASVLVHNKVAPAP